MKNIISASIDHTRTVLMIFVLLLVSGAVTYLNIPKESNPDVPIPFIYVSIVHDGIAPEDAERMLVKPMERELRSIDGLKEMKATAGEGFASITMEFVAGFDSKEALADVRDKVTVARAKLPEETEEPTIHEITMAGQQAVLTVVLSGPVSERALITTARELQNGLEGLSEVLEVDIGGDREDLVEIIVDPLLLESYRLDQSEILTLLSRNNRLVPAGTMDTGVGSFAVKVPSVFETVKDVLEQPIKVDGDRVITFEDVAQVRRSYKDPAGFARLDSHPSVSLEIKKRPGENLLITVEKVKAFVEQAKGSSIWPNSVNVTYTGDQSININTMLGDLQNNVTSAVVLVAIVIVAILGVRTAFLVGVSIPGSFLTGILVISLFGYTLNMVVLFSLIMAVGMLVDGAIVVTEYADRCMSEGQDKKSAYKNAALRMAWPIIASTATTLAAFAPLMFWPGIMGEFMKYLPFTLIAVLTASLLMALVFVPTLGAAFGKPRYISEKTRQQLEQAEHGDLLALDGYTGGYIRFLSKAIAHPLKSLSIAVVFGLVIFTLYISSGLGVEFFPKADSQGVNITVRSTGDYSVYEKDNIIKEVEAKLIDMPEIDTLYSRSGGQDQIGTLRLNLLDWHLRAHSDEVLIDVEKRIGDMPGLDIEVAPDQEGPQSGKDLQIEISSRYPELLNDAALKIRKALDANSKFTSIGDTASKPGIEWQLKVNRSDAARFGADATLVGNTVQFVTTGLRIGEYRPDDVDDELDIRVRFPRTDRYIGKLDELRLKTANGLVPISNFVERTAQLKTDLIRHVDSKRVLQVEANMVPGELLSIALPELREQLPKLNIDPRVEITIKGQNEQQEESQAFLLNAFLIALFVMAIILVTQFNSFYQAFLILSAVLFSIVGVVLGLLIFQKPFGIVMSGVGVIALAGIVVNNNIVLIDTYNILKSEGLKTTEAILRTGAQRLRPVMMTTVTTILGLLPMVMGVNIDFMGRNVDIGGPSTEYWSQLATAVAGGLAFATVLTLVLTPCMLAFKDNLRAYLPKPRTAIE
ncbi:MULTISPECIES: efflux RND transporter permease subunit [Alteromonadaceae]|uniref:efflux RND transporter permease subunit n=1 Tax=Alteromonadaceae TaxID=72275 RepID=UPI001C0801A4|nr:MULTISPECIES: efflux RND transporter permease subunit [Aliiglaciecola]MBU2879421.1 efflux RND transporter permease subunit [Aliiglaciecola lipolytica]MDO6712463.1 efflux RND transporter permease subunit [Aliiglaciecola sp. 2_MG-2023]MDO6753479.1 efflux RND transporter permease subunit [Aliiglaciecola sp. 1_MG-2023]